MFFLREWYYDIKNFIIRGRRGWAPSDAWDGHHYLARIIAGMVRQLAKHNTGCPQELFDAKNLNNECHPWKVILEEIAQGFDAFQEMDSTHYSFMFKKNNQDIYERQLHNLKRKQLTQKYDRGMELFAKYFMSLWD